MTSVQVTITIPGKAGDTFPTPFGTKTISDSEAAGGFYNHSFSASRSAVADIAAESAQKVVTAEAESIAATIGGQPMAFHLDAAALAAEYSVAELLAAATAALVK